MASDQTRRLRNPCVEWSMWANEQAVASAIILFFGGILGVAGMFKNWQYAAAVIPASVIVFLIEWPRGNRPNGKRTLERRYQFHLTKMVKSISILNNFVFRAILMILVSVPSCFLLPTLLGGLCLMISSLLYLAATCNKEQWKPIVRSQTKRDKTFPPQPTDPPPRNLHHNFGANNLSSVEDNRF